MAFNTPFKMWKRYEFNGGTSDPCIISWPAAKDGRREIREQYCHAIDLVPTVLDLLGVEAPESIKGHTQSPFDGVSCATLDDAKAPAARQTQFYSMLGSRGIWHEGWKAVTTHPTIAGWGHFNDDEWELYHTDVDRSELHNLAAEQPDKVRELVNIWFSEAGANGAFPLDDRSALEIMSTPRPQLTAPRDRYVVLSRHGCSPRVAVGQHKGPLVRDRRARRHPEPRAEGVLFAQGSRFGGHASLRQGQPAALREQLRRQIEQTGRRRPGHPDRREPHPLRLVREGAASSPTTLRGRCRSTTATRRSARRRSRSSSALRDRRCGPVRRPPRGRGDHRRLPGEAPHRFTGGTINRVAIDVSGEPYMDLEREAAADADARIERGSQLRAGGGACVLRRPRVLASADRDEGELQVLEALTQEPVRRRARRVRLPSSAAR